MGVLRRTTSVRRHNQLGLSGRFWEAPYDARVVQTSLSLAVRIAYDHRNPVKQGMVDAPEAYPWSSAKEWTTGNRGGIPLTLPATLPFGLDLEELRRDVLSYQATQQLDERSDELETVFVTRPTDDDALRRLLAECGIDAARR